MPALLLAATACGLPGDTEVQVVDASSVPYRLLELEPSSTSGEAEGPVPSGTPVVFWLRGDDRLVPTAVTESCDNRPDEVVERLLSLLEAAPDEGARSAGRSSAIPPSSDLELVEVADGVALVALDPATSIAADRLPLAVGQLVLTVTLAPDIEAVRVSIDGDAVQVPLPGGALTSRPVSAEDYVTLLPDRYRDVADPGRPSSDIGCRASRARRS